jgi:hypothetical protein
MLSAPAISIIEHYKHGQFYQHEQLLATLEIRVQEYMASCAGSSDAS